MNHPSRGCEDKLILFFCSTRIQKALVTSFSEAVTDIVQVDRDHHFIGVFIARRLKSPAIIYNYTISGKGGGN